jgi:hypothetical protein
MLTGQIIVSIWGRQMKETFKLRLREHLVYALIATVFGGGRDHLIIMKCLIGEVNRYRLPRQYANGYLHPNKVTLFSIMPKKCTRSALRIH